MQVINWDKVYELARNSSKEAFMAATEKIMKIDDLPAVEKFRAYMDTYQKKVLPSLLKSVNMNLPPDKFVNIVVSEVKKNKKLLDAFAANPNSMFASILFGAEIGLVPSDEIGEFFLIPRNIKQPDGSYKLTVTPLIGYKGLVKIIMRSGEYEMIESHVVYKGDKFKVGLGTNPVLQHTPKYDAHRTAENITHAYAVVHFKSGKTQFAVVTRDEILAVMNKPKEPNRLYFNDKESPNRWMEKKCALIQLSKTLDKDYYGSKAIEYDGAIEGGGILTLEGDKVKLIEGASIKPTRYRDIYGTLGKLPEVSNG